MSTTVSEQVSTPAGEAQTNVQGSVRAATKRRASENGITDFSALSKHHQDASSEPVADYSNDTAIKQLEERVTEVIHERDDALRDLSLAQKQIEVQKASIETLQRQLGSQPSAGYPALRRQLNEASRELTDARLREATRAKSEHDGIDNSSYDGSPWQAERRGLLLWIEGQQRELQKWKDEAMGKGSRTVSRCWQASVDEGVRREREKDAVVIKQLRDEMEKLKAAKGGDM